MLKPTIEKVGYIVIFSVAGVVFLIVLFYAIVFCCDRAEKRKERTQKYLEELEKEAARELESKQQNHKLRRSKTQKIQEPP